MKGIFKSWLLWLYYTTIASFAFSFILEVAVGPPDVKIFDRTVDNYMSVFAVENAIYTILGATGFTLADYIYTAWGKLRERRKTIIQNTQT